jgi:hypothetical protein
MALNGVLIPKHFRGETRVHDDVLDFFVAHLINAEMTINQHSNRSLAFSTPPFCR